MSITPLPGEIEKVTTGGTAEEVFPTNILGGYIQNPFDAQGVLYVDPVGDAGLEAVGTTFAIQPGQTWSAPPGQATATTVNAADSDHNFSSIYWTV